MVCIYRDEILDCLHAAAGEAEEEAVSADGETEGGMFNAAAASVCGYQPEDWLELGF